MGGGGLPRPGAQAQQDFGDPAGAFVAQFVLFPFAPDVVAGLVLQPAAAVGQGCGGQGLAGGVIGVDVGLQRSANHGFRGVP